MKLSGKPIKNLKVPVPSDIEISQEEEKNVLPIYSLAKDEMGLLDSEIIPYGKTKAKIDYKKVLTRLKTQNNGNYVVITGVNPTPLGEGKSTTAVGISQSIGAHLKKNTIACLRQPSQGPTFGIKGGAAGGGYSQIIPMTDFNLHLTGDIHAITATNNLLASAIDTRYFHEKRQSTKGLFNRLCPIIDKKTGKREPFLLSMKKRLLKLGIIKDLNDKISPEDLTTDQIKQFVRLNIDPNSITWKRVVDTNDRYLRKITIGQSDTEKGITRETGFDITVASEVMACLALANDLKDLRERFGKIVFGNDLNGNPLTVEDLGAAGAMTVLMKDAIHPTLMQTIESTPVFIHAGPFANIAHGNSSIIADKVALKVVGEDGYVLTEAGFGADIGMEKFFDIKCRYSGLIPDCVVIVVSIRALKFHGGMNLNDIKNQSKGKKLNNLTDEQIQEMVIKGSKNMVKHIENAKKFGVNVVVCINKFTNDTKEEIDIVKKEALKAGAFDCCVSNHWAEGGKGAIDISKSIVKACQQSKSNKDNNKFKFLYQTEKNEKQEINLIKKNIETIAKQIYGAKEVEYSKVVLEKIENFTKIGFDNLPICVAKTQYSLSHDPSLLGVPKDFVFPIKDIRCYTGAGLIVPLCGTISTIPGLPTRPAYLEIDYDFENDKIVGLF